MVAVAPPDVVDRENKEALRAAARDAASDLSGAVPHAWAPPVGVPPLPPPPPPVGLSAGGRAAPVSSAGSSPPVSSLVPPAESYSGSSVVASSSAPATSSFSVPPAAAASSPVFHVEESLTNTAAGAMTPPLFSLPPVSSCVPLPVAPASAPSPLDYLVRPLYPDGPPYLSPSTSRSPSTSSLVPPPYVPVPSSTEPRQSVAAATAAPSPVTPSPRSRRSPLGRAIIAAPAGAAASAVPRSPDCNVDGLAPSSTPTGSSAASLSTRSADLRAVAANVDSLAASYQDVREKLAVVSDAVSGASSKLETHGKAIESFGSIMNGLKTSVNCLTDVIRGHLSQESGGAGEGKMSSPVDPESAVVNVDATDPQVPTKVRRLETASGDVKEAAMQASFMKRLQAEATERVIGMHHMIAIRRIVNDRLTKSMSTANTCAEVYHDADTFARLVLESVIQHFECNEMQAKVFLKSTIIQPTKKRGGAAVKSSTPAVNASSSSDDAKHAVDDQPESEPITVRAAIPLHAVQPHLIEAIKKRVVPTFFSAVGLNARTITLMQVMRWLARNLYTNSDNGRKAMRECVLVMYRYLGVSDRVQDKDVGDGPVVVLSVGHYALVSCFVRHALEMAVAKAYSRSTRRTGVEPGLYVRWRTELLRVNEFLEKDNDAHRGMSLLDGDNENRAVLSTAENEIVDRMYRRQQEDDDRYARLLDRLEKEIEDRRQQTTADKA